jgi:hypothetical protein
VKIAPVRHGGAEEACRQDGRGARGGDGRARVGGGHHHGLAHSRVGVRLNDQLKRVFAVRAAMQGTNSAELARRLIADYCAATPQNLLRDVAAAWVAEHGGCTGHDLEYAVRAAYDEAVEETEAA